MTGDFQGRHVMTHRTTNGMGSARARLIRRTAIAASGVGACCAMLAPAAAAQAATFEGKVKIKKAPVAISCPVTFPFACFDPSEGNSAIVRIKFKGTFESVEQVCFTFHFEGDLVDAGEVLLYSVTGTDGQGFSNPSGPSISERESCLNTGHPDQMAAFLDGRQQIVVFMRDGSASLSDVDVQLTGTPA